MVKIVYIDMDGVLCDFVSAFRDALKHNPSIKFPQSQYGFFSNLRPIDNAIDSVNELNLNPKYDVYILTSPSVRNPLSYTEKRVWIGDKFGLEFAHKLIISPNKGLLRGDILIDDNISGNGQENFKGTVMEYGGDIYPDWISIAKTLN
jgi:5'-nucleotidase